MLISSTGEIYGAGASYCGTGGQGLAKFNGSTWGPVCSSCSLPELDGVISVMALNNSNGNLFVAGTFSTLGGIAANNLGMFNGTKWVNIGNTNMAASAMLVDGLGRLFIGGSFTNISGNACRGLAMMISISSGWTCLQNTTNMGPIQYVYSIVANTTDTVNNSLFMFAGLISGQSKLFLYTNGTLTNLQTPILGQVLLAYSPLSNILYIALGVSSNIDLESPYSLVASYDGSNWNNMAGGLLGTRLISMSIDNNGNVYFLGFITRSRSGVCVSTMIKWSLTSAPPSPAPTSISTSAWRNVVNALQLNTIISMSWDFNGKELYFSTSCKKKKKTNHTLFNPNHLHSITTSFKYSLLFVSLEWYRCNGNDDSKRCFWNACNSKWNVDWRHIY